MILIVPAGTRRSGISGEFVIVAWRQSYGRNAASRTV
jgi:hypothetical protein